MGTPIRFTASQLNSSKNAGNNKAIKTLLSKNPIVAKTLNSNSSKQVFLKFLKEENGSVANALRRTVDDKDDGISKQKANKMRAALGESFGHYSSGEKNNSQRKPLYVSAPKTFSTVPTSKEDAGNNLVRTLKRMDNIINSDVRGSNLIIKPLD